MPRRLGFRRTECISVSDATSCQVVSSFAAPSESLYDRLRCWSEPPATEPSEEELDADFLREMGATPRELESAMLLAQELLARQRRETARQKAQCEALKAELEARNSRDPQMETLLAVQAAEVASLTAALAGVTADRDALRRLVARGSQPTPPPEVTVQASLPRAPSSPLAVSARELQARSLARSASDAQSGDIPPLSLDTAPRRSLDLGSGL